MPKYMAFVTTTPFGTVSPEPINLLKAAGIECVLNPFGERMTLPECAPYLAEANYIIAGLAPFTPEILDAAPNLKVIARVGVGVNNIQFAETAKRGIKVANTPDAPTQAVAELTLGLMLSLLRNIPGVDRGLRAGEWNQYMGGLLQGKTVGIVGASRIGRQVIRLLKPFGVRVLANDIIEDKAAAELLGFNYVDKETLFRESDIISLHVSYSPSVHHLINTEAIAKMKPTALLINTARGPVVSEEALCTALVEKRLGGAALDVFENEPYRGKLTEFNNVVLTPHIGSASKESRIAMEVGAVEEILRFHRGEPLKNEVRG